MPRLYLGTHKPHWLWSGQADFPLCVSRRTLARYVTLYPATCPGWVLDSGAFTELSMFGSWRLPARQYVAQVARCQREIGRLDWAAPQDWPCEPAMIHGGRAGKVTVPGTRLSVDQHQHRTVANYLELRELWPEYSDAPCPFIPVIQGWTVADYVRCTYFYTRAGVMLNQQPAVGIGSVCRLQDTDKIIDVMRAMRMCGRLHGFGVKTQGLAMAGQWLASVDSQAWSYDARRSAPMRGHAHSSCSNCLPYAARWRARLLDAA